ncbi:MAG: hypothetical protein HYY57_01370 [Candidatus Omnitrophica bacterium]|nr:hypothetical protein [Candidatus Omnitrophota bacterium]
MIRCPICQRALNPAIRSPYAPICSEACRREALRRAGVSEPQPEEPDVDSQQAQFQELNATHLYCSRCRQSMPTRSKLLLTLPNGELYGYTCARCNADVGTKTERR